MENNLKTNIKNKNARKKKISTRDKIITIILIILLSILAFMQIFPFYLQLVTSLQPTEGFTPVDGKIYLWPVKFCFSNYLTAITEGDLIIGLLNTLFVSIAFIILSLIVILIVGYVTTKKKFRGKKIIVFILLLTMMVPGEMLMVTNYQLVSKLHWTSTYQGLILPGIVNVTGIFLVRAFMSNVPDSCIESAVLDGANEFQVIRKIVFPMCMPVIATYCILTFVAQWNDYLWPMLITGDDRKFTIQLKLLNFAANGGYEETVLKAAALILTLFPVIILYCLCQKQFVTGLNFTGEKE